MSVAAVPVIGYATGVRVLFLIVLALFGSAHLNAAEKVYRTVDEDGNIVFTDRLDKNAEEITLQELQTIRNPSPAKYEPLPKQVSDVDPSNLYRSLLVSRPADGSALRNNAGNISITVSLQPSLRLGHKMLITLDNKEISNGRTFDVSLKNVDRGTHEVGAKVLDDNGDVLISTTSSFSLLRAHQ